MVACLRTLDSEDFWKPTPPAELFPYVAAPIVDGDYFPDLPLNLIEEGMFNKDVDIMLGNMDIEGYLFAIAIYPDLHLPDFDRDKFQSEIAMVVIPGSFPHLPDKWEVIAEAATEEYAADLEGDDLRFAASEMLGDLFICVYPYLTAELFAG